MLQCQYTCIALKSSVFTFEGAMKHSSSTERSLEFLRLLVVHQPEFIVSCADTLRSKLTPLTRYSDEHLLRTLSQSSTIAADASVLRYLELFHVVEQSSDNYYLCPSAYSLSGCMPLTSYGSSGLLQFDFDDFLPSCMITYLTCKLAERTAASAVEFSDAQTAVIVSRQIQARIDLQFDLGRCVAVIAISSTGRLCYRYLCTSVLMILRSTNGVRLYACAFLHVSMNLWVLLQFRGSGAC